MKKGQIFIIVVLCIISFLLFSGVSCFVDTVTQLKYGDSYLNIALMYIMIGEEELTMTYLQRAKDEYNKELLSCKLIGRD